MITLVLIFFSGIFSSPFAFTSYTEIYWEQSRNLTYDDFKGAVPTATPWAATTSSMINFSYETLNGKLSNVVVYASFIPEKSWMKKRLPEVLAHEQLHFDITEIFARKFYIAVMHKSSASKNDLTALFKSVNHDCQDLQEQYDDETDHGTIEDKQANWKEKIASLLASTEPYPSKH